MDFSNYNINIDTNHIINDIILHNTKYIFLLLFIVLIVSIVLFIVCSYFVLKFLKMSIDNNNVLFYKYNKKSQKILDLYGDCKINKIYLTRKPIDKLCTFLLNIISLYKYDKLITNDVFLRHNSIIFEIKLSNGKTKLLYLEKTNSINIYENFVIENNLELKTITLNNNKYTINSILNSTQERVGNNKFFNWHIYKNNCKGFIKDILKTIYKCNKTNKKFISCEININTFVKTVIPNEFIKHIINSLINICNIIEKYIYEGNFYNLC